MPKMTRKEGYMNEMISYIKKNTLKGYSAESLKWALVNQGYPKIEVEKAIAQVARETAKSTIMHKAMEEKPIIKYEVIPEVEEKKGFFSRFFGK